VTVTAPTNPETICSDATETDLVFTVESNTTGSGTQGLSLSLL